jgi:hypothetical protein
VWGFPAPPNYKLPSKFNKFSKFLKHSSFHLNHRRGCDPELLSITYSPKLSFGAMALLALCIPSIIDVRYHLQQSLRTWKRSTNRGIRNSLVFITGSLVSTPGSNDTNKVIICGFIGRRDDDDTFEAESRKLFIQLAPIYKIFAPEDRRMLDLDMFINTQTEVEPTRGWFSLWSQYSHVSQVGIEDRKGTMKVKWPKVESGLAKNDQAGIVAQDELMVDEFKLFCFAS